jgi:hypothetical protein
MAIDVTIVAGSVQLSKDGKVIRGHPIRHDRSRELGAFANPQGRPAARTPPSATHPCDHVAWLPELICRPRCRYLTFTVRRSPAAQTHGLAMDGTPGWARASAGAEDVGRMLPSAARRHVAGGIDAPALGAWRGHV